jgi:hypothetical protein
MFVQNTLKNIVNYLKEFLDDSDSHASGNSVTPTPNKIPESKLESYLTINGYKLPIVD